MTDHAHPPNASQQVDVDHHLGIARTLWLIVAILGLVGALIGFAAFAFVSSLGGLGATEMIIIAVVAAIPVIFGFVVAHGLHHRTSWGRTVGFVGSVLVLFSFPLGTALGAYTLWVLTRPGAEERFGAAAQASGEGSW